LASKRIRDLRKEGKASVVVGEKLRQGRKKIGAKGGGEGESELEVKGEVNLPFWDTIILPSMSGT